MAVEVLKNITSSRGAMILTSGAMMGICGCTRAPSSAATESTTNSILARPRGTGTATLSWAPPTRNVDGSPINDLAGYYIHYGTSPSALTRTILVKDPALTSYVVDELSPGTYYFSVVAFTATGIKGRPTATVAKTIP